LTQPAPSRTNLILGFSRPEWALIASTFCWGGTFLAVQTALSTSGPLFFVGARFSVSALFAIAFSWRVLKGLTQREILAGLAVSLAVFAGYALQTYGLHFIPSSKSAFITALYVPMVPLLQWAVLRHPPKLMAWVGIGLAFVGLTLLAGRQAGAMGLGQGELLTLAGAVGTAIQIILISVFAGQVNARRVTVIQLMATAALSFGSMPLLGETLPAFSWVWLSLATVLGLATSLIQIAMNWAQQSVSPTRATLIYAGEPVWAGLVGRIAGERLPAAALFGAALVVAGVVVSELKIPRKSR
jgi:drug/metabolite transporter (DMT)-like permease